MTNAVLSFCMFRAPLFVPDQRKSHSESFPQKHGNAYA